MTDSETGLVTVKKSRLPVYISLFFIATIILCYFLIEEVRIWLNNTWLILTSGDQMKIEQWISGFGWFGPIVIVLAMIVQMFLIIIPSWLLIIVSVVAYGPIWGSLIVFGAVCAASSVGYSIGRYFGPVVMQKLVGRKTEQKVAEFIERYGVWAIIITRINPLLSNDAISIMAGIARMGYWKFIAGTMFGIAPLIVLIAVLGEFSSGLKSGLLGVSVFSLVAFILYVWIDKKRKRRTA